MGFQSSTQGLVQRPVKVNLSVYGHSKVEHGDWTSGPAILANLLFVRTRNESDVAEALTEHQRATHKFPKVLLFLLARSQIGDTAGTLLRSLELF